MSTTVTRPLHLVLVTPETTLLNEPVRALRVPLYDGSLGILPGRAPLVGRLGAGELRITTNSGEKTFFVDGGFVQVRGETVTVLTDRAMPVGKLSVQQATEALETARELRPTTDDGFAQKERDLDRARKMLSLAQRN